MSDDYADTLDLYASIFEKPRRHDGELVPASEICMTAAKALRRWADQLRPGDE